MKNLFYCRGWQHCGKFEDIKAADFIGIKAVIMIEKYHEQVPVPCCRPLFNHGIGSS